MALSGTWFAQQQISNAKPGVSRDVLRVKITTAKRSPRLFTLGAISRRSYVDADIRSYCTPATIRPARGKLQRRQLRYPAESPHSFTRGQPIQMRLKAVVQPVGAAARSAQTCAPGGGMESVGDARGRPKVPFFPSLPTQAA